MLDHNYKLVERSVVRERCNSENMRAFAENRQLGASTGRVFMDFDEDVGLNSTGEAWGILPWWSQECAIAVLRRCWAIGEN
jgi:hypothetical protein